jgi:peptidoglycan L-alanyl-D-glutamate endopeptidase CwlK
MAKLGKASEEKLSTCRPELQTFVRAVVERLPPPYDLTVVFGYRGEADQNQAFSLGFSKKPFPFSKHNKKPSEAVDVIPYPIDWQDTHAIAFLAGFMRAVAVELGISHKLRWLGDPDNNGKIRGQTFTDMPHWEIID